MADEGTPLCVIKSMTKRPVLEEIKNYKLGLEDELSLSTTPIQSLQILKKLLHVQTISQRLKRRLELSLKLQNDKKDLLRISDIQQKSQIKQIEKELEVKKKIIKDMSSKIDLVEGVFNDEAITKDLAIKLLGEKFYCNVVSQGINIGNAELRKEVDSDWKKVNVLMYKNLLFLTKPGSDIVLSIIYVNSQYKLLFTEDQRRRFMLKIGKYVLSAETKEEIAVWKEQITSRTMWYVENSVKKKLVTVKKQVPTIMNATAFSRMSMSILSSAQLSPHLTKEDVIGVSLHDLMQRERSQSAPLVYRLLIQFITDNCCDVEGILRLSGGGDEVQRLESIISRRSFSLQDLKDVDPHAISSTLKGLFRRLPVPLIPFNINEQIEGFIKKNLPNFQLVLKVRQLLMCLKDILPEHFEVFKLLCRMFTEIINKKPTNKMGLQNVLTCFVESVKCCPAVFSCALQNQGIFFDCWE